MWQCWSVQLGLASAVALLRSQNKNMLKRSSMYLLEMMNILPLTGLEFRGKIHKTAGLVAENFYWTRILFTRPESK